MITKSIDRHAAYFRIFTADIVFRDERLHLLAHRVVNCDLASDRGATSSFSATASLSQSTSISCFNATQRSRAFTLGQRAAQFALHRFDRRRLFARDHRALPAKITSTQTSTTTTASGARRLTATVT